jgi:hypothetical protein
MEKIFEKSIQIKYFAFAVASLGLLYGTVNGADKFYLKMFFILMGIIIFTIIPYTMFIAKHYIKSHIKIGILVLLIYLIAAVMHSILFSIISIVMFITTFLFYLNKLNEKIEIDEHHTPLKLIWSNKKAFRYDFIIFIFFMNSVLAANLL